MSLRGFLSNVVPDQTFLILQEELESKIAENERLVMDSCELEREKKRILAKVESMETEISQFGDKIFQLTQQVELAKKAQEQMGADKQRAEIRADSLARELELNSEQVTQLISENLELKDKESELNVLRTDFTKLHNKLVLAESKAKHSESELIRIEKKSNSEKAVAHANSVRIDQLLEQVAIYRAATVTDSPSPNLTSCTAAPCSGCARAEYYQARCRNLEAAFKEFKKS